MANLPFLICEDCGGLRFKRLEIGSDFGYVSCVQCHKVVDLLALDHEVRVEYTKEGDENGKRGRSST